ncbi:MAG: hypothetical protein AAB527_01400, partial [Patescibacteria group bacterium]
AKEKLEIVASLCEAKTAKEPGKTIGSNHVLGERRKENFLIIEFIGFWQETAEMLIFCWA